MNEMALGADLIPVRGRSLRMAKWSFTGEE
jgi:hypothetical protein